MSKLGILKQIEQLKKNRNNIDTKIRKLENKEVLLFEYDGKEILKYNKKFENKDMEYTLGGQRDEDNELYSDVYKWEWKSFKNRLEIDISNLKPAQMKLTPEILAYLIINQWRGVWCDESDLNISELKKLSSKIINQL